jgi:hypothetical protein
MILRPLTAVPADADNDVTTLIYELLADGAS